jgi:hypothetical protein
VWVDLWRAATYDADSGGLVLGKAAIVDGQRTVTAPTPPDEIPLFVRAGALLPLLPPDVDTLADYGGGEIVRLADRRDHLEILAFPRGRSSGHAFRRERLRSIEGDGRWELAIAGAPTRTWTLQASFATLERPFVPCAVEVSGEPLPASAWSFDPATQVLRATWQGRNDRLVARAACD